MRKIIILSSIAVLFAISGVSKGSEGKAEVEPHWRNATFLLVTISEAAAKQIYEKYSQIYDVTVNLDKSTYLQLPSGMSCASQIIDGDTKYTCNVSMDKDGSFNFGPPRGGVIGVSN